MKQEEFIPLDELTAVEKHEHAIVAFLAVAFAIALISTL